MHPQEIITELTEEMNRVSKNKVPEIKFVPKETFPDFTHLYPSITGYKFGKIGTDSYEIHVVGVNFDLDGVGAKYYAKQALTRIFHINNNPHLFATIDIYPGPIRDMMMNVVGSACFFGASTAVTDEIADALSDESRAIEVNEVQRGSYDLSEIAKAAKIKGATLADALDMVRWGLVIGDLDVYPREYSNELRQLDKISDAFQKKFNVSVTFS